MSHISCFTLLYKSESPQKLTKLHNSLATDTVISVFIKHKFGPLVACFVVYVFPAGVHEMVERPLITNRQRGFRCSIEHLKVCTKTKVSQIRTPVYLCSLGKNAENLLSPGERKLPDNVVMTL
jgi:hypothetical protein